VLELVGAPSLELVQHQLAARARVVVIGVGAGGSATLSLLGVMARRATITGSTLRSRSRAEKAAVAEGLRRDVLPLLAAGSIRVPLAAAFSLDDVEVAYEAFARPGKLGKLVLEVRR
jgi:NADPH:quinone reductase-like Zn-dependent oxidoreductase